MRVNGPNKRTDRTEFCARNCHLITHVKQKLYHFSDIKCNIKERKGTRDEKDIKDTIYTETHLCPFAFVFYVLFVPYVLCPFLFMPAALAALLQVAFYYSSAAASSR